MGEPRVSDGLLSSRSDKEFDFTSRAKREQKERVVGTSVDLDGSVHRLLCHIIFAFSDIPGKDILESAAKQMLMRAVVKMAPFDNTARAR